MKENSIKNERSSIEEDIKIALDKFSDNKDIDSAILIVEKFILGNYILRGGRKNIVKDSLRYILSDYKRVLKENEELNEKILDNAGIYQLGFKDGEESYIKKVKDKIEELNREIGKSIDNSKGGLDEEFIEKARELLVQKRILQELLEGRKI